MRRKKLVTIVAFVLCFFVSMIQVNAATETEKGKTQCETYYKSIYAAQKCGGDIDIQLPSQLPAVFNTSGVSKITDYRSATVTINSRGNCSENNWNKNMNSTPKSFYSSLLGYSVAYETTCNMNKSQLLNQCKSSCTSKINSCSGANSDKVTKFCNDSCSTNAYEEKDCDMYNASVKQQDVDSCVDNCAQTSGDAIREDCERVCKNYDSVYAKYKDAEGSVCSWTGNRQNVINAIATRENHIQIDAKNVCTDTCTEDIIPIIQEKASGIVFSKNNLHGATESMARTYGKTECNTTCKTVSSSAIEEGAICTNYNLSVDVDYNEKVKPQLDTLADQAIEKMKKDYGVNESETEEETPEKEYEKPEFVKVSREGGCVIMGDDLSNLLGEIYKWARGGCAAVIVILGVLDFLKATASDDPATLKKSGSTFVKRILVLAVFILLPYLLDFILDLLLGADFETCMDPFK